MEALPVATRLAQCAIIRQHARWPHYASGLPEIDRLSSDLDPIPNQSLPVPTTMPCSVWGAAGPGYSILASIGKLPHMPVRNG
jgi:hypothetical protein